MPDGFVIYSCRSGFQHLYQYSYSGSMQRQITSGDYDVIQYYGCDAATGLHYYSSTASGAINRMISRVDRKGKVTDLTPAEGTSTARFSPNMDYYVLSYSNTTTPPRYTLHQSSNNKAVRTIEENTEYKSRWSQLPNKEFFTMTSDGVKLNGYIIYPEGFNASRKYPVVM